MKKRVILTTGGIILIVIGLIFIFLYSRGCENAESGIPSTTAASESETALPDSTAADTEEESEKIPYKSPIDFEALKEENPEIIGWIDIPSTDISYPVYQRKGDDAYYLNHNRKCNYDVYGEIYSEATYNSDDFTDPVTLLYGHNPGNKTMFGKLQILFADADTIKENPEIIIYTEKCEYHYTVFAATTFDNRHIMYNYDFDDKNVYDSFFDLVKNTRSVDTYFNEDVFNKGLGKNIILSTCKNGNGNKRFLVMAAATEIIN